MPKMLTGTFWLPLFLAWQAYAAPMDRRSEAGIVDSELTGGPHGTSFTDFGLIGSDHKRISYIKMTGGCYGPPSKYKERVSQLQLTYRDNYNPAHTATVSHGGTEGSKSTADLKLDTNEYITKVEIGDYSQSVGKFFSSTWTRVGYIKFTTSKNRSLACGDVHKTETLHTLEFKDTALLHFTGQQGAMLDRLVAHWIPKDNF